MICLHHLRIHAILLDEFAVRALFDDATAFDDDDLVGLEDGVEAMRNGEGCASLHEFARGFFKQGFGLGVKAGGGFVEDEDGRILEEGAGKGESLCLSAAETRSAFADDGLVLVGECLDEVVQVGGFGGFDHLFESCIWFAEADIGGEGVMEEVGFLRNPGNILVKLVIVNW